MAASRTGSASPPGWKKPRRWWSTSSTASSCRSAVTSPPPSSPARPPSSPTAPSGASAVPTGCATRPTPACRCWASATATNCWPMRWAARLPTTRLGANPAPSACSWKPRPRPIRCSPACRPASRPTPPTCRRCCAHPKAPPCWRVRCRTTATPSAGASKPATHHMRGYVRARADCIARHGGCARSVARDVSAAPLARQLLRRFVRHVRREVH